MEFEKNKLKNLKEKLIGRKLKSIIYLTIDEKLKNWIRYKMTNDFEYDIDMAQLLILDNCYILFVDLDCDGYRSGDWFVKDFKKFAKEFLDKGYTHEIKTINSKIIDIDYYDNAKSINGYDFDSEFLLIETKDYIVEMGQDNVSDYYPQNFFCVEDIKDMIIQKNYTKKK